MNNYKLLEVFGIELEYMVVDRRSLNVKPMADLLFEKVTGQITSDVENDRIDWSNELVTHVVEFKNNTPESSLSGLYEYFQNEVRRANECLQEFDARLLPGASHPWMDPKSETKVWPHGNKEIYRTYDRVFGCSGHGWSNLQSLHINISFADDRDFEKLHAAIRFVLPLIPALSSSSPYMDGKRGPNKSNRLLYYLQNQRRIPSIIGMAIPEQVWSYDEYQKQVLQPMYNDIKPLDTEGILQKEWLNSRGAIAKFERGCIEIRLADVQEAPVVDLAIADFWTKVIRQLTKETWLDLEKLKSLQTVTLRKVLDQTVVHGEEAIIDAPEYISCLGPAGSAKASDLISQLLGRLEYNEADSIYRQQIEKILKQGTLSTRICQSVGNNDSREAMKATYQQLADCLADGRFFEVG